MTSRPQPSLKVSALAAAPFGFICSVALLLSACGGRITSVGDYTIPKAVKTKTKTQPKGAGAGDSLQKATESPVTTDGASASSSLTYYNFAKAVLDEKCSGCHWSDSSTDGNVALDTYDDAQGISGAYTKRLRIAARVELGTMPPEGSDPLTPEEATKLVEWAKAGAPLGTPPGSDQDATSNGENPMGPVDMTDPAVGTGALADMGNDATPMSQTGTSGTMGTEAPVAGPLIFTSPVEAVQADASLTVMVEFSGVDEGSTWNLFYTPNASDLGSLEAIALDLGTTETSVEWDTSAIPEGNYYLYATLSLVDQIVVLPNLTPVTVAHPQPGNSIPTVKVLSPNGGEKWMLGELHTISWEMGDPDREDVASLRADVDISLNNGMSWTSLATNVRGSQSTWTPDGDALLTTFALLRVTVSDGRGGLASDRSDSNFEIASTIDAAPNMGAVEPAPATPSPPPPATPAVPTYADFDAIAQRSCSGSGCHTSASGGRNDYTANEATVISRKSSIIRMLENGKMPKDGSLTSSELQIMLGYLNSI